MSKNSSNIRSGQLVIPDFGTGGLGVRLWWRPFRTLPSGCAPSGEQASKGRSLSRQTLFALLCRSPLSPPQKARISAIFGMLEGRMLFASARRYLPGNG